MLLSRASVAALPLLLAASAYAQWPLYAPSPIGLTTPVHTHPDGYRSLSITSTAPDGATCGNQSRFSAGSELAVGTSAFVYIPGALPSTGGGTTHRIGFYSSQYADAATGEAHSVASNITDGRTVGGKSTTLDGAVHAWAWTESAGEVRIGLQGADHTSPAGKQYSSVIGAANSANVLFGSSYRFGGTGQGETRRATNQSLFAWTAQGGTERMGFFGNAYTESDGEQNTYSSPPPYADNWSDNGYFVGVSDRFDATPGKDGWVWHRTTGSVRCGLRGVGYTSSNNGFNVVPQVVSNTGVVAGYSAAYDPVTFSFRGYQSWAWNPTTGAVPIGLTGPEYLNSNGQIESDIRGIGPGGQVIGRSRNGQTGVNDGMDAWFWNAAAGTQRIGLYGPDFTGNNNGGDGYENYPSQVYATGLVAGYAKDKLFDIDPPIVVAWLFTPGAGANPGTTVEVIPPGAQFRSTSGRRWSTISDVNPATGRVLGYAKFYDDEIERGYKAFTFNPSNGNYFVFSVDANANGDSTTIPLRIFDDQTVLGNFLDYNEEDGAAPPVVSGFLWRAGQGTADLLSRIDTGDGGLTGLGLEGPASCVGYSRLTSYDAFLSYVRRSGFPDGYNNAFVLLRSLPCGTTPDLFSLKDLYAAARQPVMTVPQGADQALVHSVAQTGVTPMRGVRLGGAGAPFTNPVIWGAIGVSTNIPAVGPTVNPGDSLPLTTGPRAASLSGVLIQPGAGGGAGIDAAVSTYRPGQAGILSTLSLDAEVLGSASDGVRISLVRLDNANVSTTIIAQQPVAYSASGHTSLTLSGGVLPLALAADDRLVLTVDRGGAGSTATQDYTVVDLRFGFVGPPLIITQPTMGPDACIDQDQSISVVATSAAAYQWRKDGVDLTDGPTGHSSRINGATTATLTIRSVSPEDAGEYTCLVSNTCGSSVSMTSTLTVETCACGPADIGQAGGIGGFDGQLDNNDFIVFITLFFVQAPAADRGVQGGFPGIDGQFDNNDFIVFINQFFEGC